VKGALNATVFLSRVCEDVIEVNTTEESARYLKEQMSTEIMIAYIKTGHGSTKGVVYLLKRNQDWHGTTAQVHDQLRGHDICHRAGTKRKQNICFPSSINEPNEQ